MRKINNIEMETKCEWHYIFNRINSLVCNIRSMNNILSRLISRWQHWILITAINYWISMRRKVFDVCITIQRSCHLHLKMQIYFCQIGFYLFAEQCVAFVLHRSNEKKSFPCLILMHEKSVLRSMGQRYKPDEWMNEWKETEMCDVALPRIDETLNFFSRHVW